MSYEDEPPFEPTAMIEEPPFPAVTEEDPEELKKMWRLSRARLTTSMQNVEEDLSRLAAVEDAMRRAAPESAKECGRQYRRCLDDRDWARMLESRMQKRQEIMEAVFAALGRSTGIQSFPTGYVTVSVKDKQTVEYDADQYEGIIRHLVGVAFDGESVERVLNAGHGMQDGQCDEAEFERAIRELITVGDLGCIQRRFSLKPVAGLAASSRGLPEGLRIKTLDHQVSYTRPATSAKADQL